MCEKAFYEIVPAFFRVREVDFPDGAAKTFSVSADAREFVD